MELILFLLSGMDQSGSLGLIYASCSFLKELVLPEEIRKSQGEGTGRAEADFTELQAGSIRGLILSIPEFSRDGIHLRD